MTLKNVKVLQEKSKLNSGKEKSYSFLKKTLIAQDVLQI